MTLLGAKKALKMKESLKRQRTKVKDPITGESWWEWKDKITIRYDEEEKLPIILEILKGANTPEELTEKYHICSVQTLLAWVGRYLTEENSLTLQDKPKSPSHKNLRAPGADLGE